MNHTAPLIQSSIATQPAKLQQLVSHIKTKAVYERDRLGWGKGRSFRDGSLFGKWAQFEAQAEQDFKERAKKGSVFEDSNLSQNLPFSIGCQHHDKITRDLLQSPKFFDANPEGEEEAMMQSLIQQMAAGIKPTDLLLRVLHKESRVRKFNTKLAKSVWHTLFRGHEIIRPCYEKRTMPRRVSLSAWMVNNVPVRDSKNQIVMEDRVWVPDPQATDPKQAELILKDDPSIHLPVGTIVTRSAEKYGVQRFITQTNGCDIQPIYWADFVIPETADWDMCDFRGHFFQSSPDLVMSLYPQEMRTAEGNNYWNRHRNNVIGRNQENDDVTARWGIERRNEDSNSQENAQAMLDPSARYYRTFFECWLNYDLDGDGYAEPLGITLDWHDETVIRIDASNVLLPWGNMDMTHPYQNMRINPVSERWYGLSYYEVYGAWHEFGDLCWNRYNLDMEQSGNLFFRNRGAFVNPADADEVGFRSNRIYDIVSSSSGTKAVQVVNVAPSANNYLDAMDRTNQRMQAHGGTMGAADPQSSALPAAKTLGGLNQILAQGDVFISARERDLIPALTEIVRVFADINVYAMQMDPSAVVRQIGEQNWAVLEQFLQMAPDHIRDHLDVDLSNAFGQDQNAIANGIIQVLNQWMQVPTGIYKKAFEPYYKMALRGLGVADPSGALVDPEAAMLAAQAQQQQGQNPNQPPSNEQPQNA